MVATVLVVWRGGGNVVVKWCWCDRCSGKVIVVVVVKRCHWRWCNGGCDVIGCKWSNDVCEVIENNS